MTLPSTIKIGAKTYTIQLMPILSDEEELGHCHPTRQLIRIDSSLPETEQEETLLHEIIHACCNFTGMFTEAKNEKLNEEEFATRLSPILYTVLKENAFEFLSPPRK